MSSQRNATGMPRPSLVREYFKTEPRRLAVLALALLGVVVAVTIPYAALVGFSEWTNNMKEASRMIWASYTPAATNLALPPRLPSVPPAEIRRSEDATALAPLTPLPSGGRSYTCTQCGSTALPSWQTGGTPRCPICQGLMTLGPNRVSAGQRAAPATALRPNEVPLR
jgi:hypothetical protein